MTPTRGLPSSYGHHSKGTYTFRAWPQANSCALIREGGWCPAVGLPARSMHNDRMILLSVSPAIGLLPPRRRRSRRRRKGRSRWRRRALRAWRTLSAAPRAVRIGIIATAVLALFAATNLVYQVARKPTEMFFPVSGALAKAP